MLFEEKVNVDHDIEVPEHVRRFAAECVARSKTIDGFGFVPSDFEHVWRVLHGLEKGRFCEWGSGMGIVTGMARLLGYDAVGIERNEQLVAASRVVMREFDVACPIYHADYFEFTVNADYYFVYCWPGEMRRVHERFESSTPVGAKLLICHGASDVRCKIRGMARSGSTLG